MYCNEETLCCFFQLVSELACRLYCRSCHVTCGLTRRERLSAVDMMAPLDLSAAGNQHNNTKKIIANATILALRHAKLAGDTRRKFNRRILTRCNFARTTPAQSSSLHI
jgi:hypothetical protein